MKKLFLSFLILLGLSTAFNANAQIVVKIKPVKPKVVVVKSKAPSAKHVWRDGHWTWNKAANKYVWKKGYWVTAKAGHTWVKGYWVKTGNGHKWVAGHWKAVKVVPTNKKRVVRTRRR